jgi:hypothetical protein
MKIYEMVGVAGRVAEAERMPSLGWVGLNVQVE